MTHSNVTVTNSQKLTCLSCFSSSSSGTWGFRIVGGKDEGLVCKVEKVTKLFNIKLFNTLILVDSQGVYSNVHIQGVPL